MEKNTRKGLGSWLLLVVVAVIVSGPAFPGEAVPIEVRHLGTNAGGWEIVETRNFRVFHYGSAQRAEKIARRAEQTRLQVEKKWFGQAGLAWSPRCGLYLYNSSQDFSRYTGLPPGLPGFARTRVEGGRILERAIDLNGENADLLPAVLPHEVTHICMWNRLGKEVPIWANEGLAVLTEPRDRVDRHLRNLPRYRKNGQLYSLVNLVGLKSYPEPRYLGPFYAQSISLVQMMAELKGPRVFTDFLRDSMNGDFNTALDRHYGMPIAQLEGSWKTRTPGMQTVQDPFLAH